MCNPVRTFTTTLRKFANYGIPSYILYFGESLGDNLLLTTLSKALSDRGFKNIWIKCDHPDLFRGNPSVRVVLPYNTLLSTHLLKLFGIKLISPCYTFYQPENDRDIIPDKHIILKMADSIGFKGPIENKPVLELDKTEEVAGRIAPLQIVIAASTSGAKMAMKNKEWIQDYYQQLVDDLGGQYNFIQLGSAGDPVLNGAMDLRGKTSLRESAAILKNSLLLITHVGFMMHLARAVDCRSVIIYGGREMPEQSGYACFTNLYSNVECSPCWQHNKCDYQHKCMTMITPGRVKDAILEALQNNTPLTNDILTNA